MATCDCCGTTIIFGGVKDDEFRFCNKKCQRNGQVVITARQLPDAIVDEHVQKIYSGPCPKCAGNGPVDIHTSHSIWSLILLSTWKSCPQMSCRSCGIKSQIKGFISSFLLGWWGFPWGLLVTPVQLIKNIIGMIKGSGKQQPSEKLHNQVRLNLATQALAEESEN